MAAAPTQPAMPSQNPSQYTAGGTPVPSTPIKESDTIPLPNLPKITQVEEWKQQVRKSFIGASGRPELAYDYICKAEQPDITFEALYDSGDFGSLDSKFATALGKILNATLRLRIRHLETAAHK